MGLKNLTKFSKKIMPNKKVIAVVGMCGAGKTEVTNYIKKKLECPNVYFGEATFDRLKKDGLVTNYKNERTVREQIRKELGPAAYAILALPKVEKNLEKNDLCTVESMYSWAEYKVLKEKFGDNFFCVAVWAPPKLRLQRLMNRTNERPIKDREEFETRDYTEIEGTDKGGPIARSDYMLKNEDSLDELHKKIDNTIVLITNF